MSETVLLESRLPGLPVRRGKVRDVYDLGDRLLLVATDRISAFDVVMPVGIPGKGRLLTAMSAFWFRRLSHVVPNHLQYVIADRAPPGLEAHADLLRGRTMVCEKAEVVPIECVVRGYLAGSGWKEYRETGRVCGVGLPGGLRQCERLPEPIFTPATKAATGHDENISFEQAADVAGAERMARLRALSIRLYTEAAEYARTRGILIADTKFEFGVCAKRVLLIDEALTPDSSRFWPADRYEPGHDQESFDKQFLRNHLESLVQQGRWDKSAPAPALPDAVVIGTAARYREAYERLTGDG